MKLSYILPLFQKMGTKLKFMSKNNFRYSSLAYPTIAATRKDLFYIRRKITIYQKFRDLKFVVQQFLLLLLNLSLKMDANLGFGL